MNTIISKYKKGCGIIVIHVVKKGDTLYSIGKEYDVSYIQIAEDNELSLTKNLVIGQTIVIMDYDVAPVTKTAEINAYAYPHINETTLDKTLPYLTYFSIFSYKVSADGSIDKINDSSLTEAANEALVQPVMVIANVEEGKGFSSDIASAILNSDEAIDNLLENVSKTMKEKGYKVLDVDFEYIYPKDREAYNSFLKKATDLMHSLGYSITTALAPKTSTTQEGVLYEGHDYNFHGKTVDHVILMTYEWGYTYSSPMPVAPINEVEKVIDFAITQMPSEKILMGIPNYGYDWTLPYVKGSAAKTVGNYQAVDLARKYKAEIMYDKEAESPYFEYVDENNKKHIVWFEDARSIYAKLSLIEKKKLAGASYWTINRFFPQNWLVLSSMYDVVKKD